MQRVSVVGNSGSGKSTVAARLAARLGAPFTELDAVNHQPDWTPLPVDEFRRQVTALTEAESWVIDGNYSAVRDIVWARADTVVWLDLPRWRVMQRVTTRTLVRVVGRRELWNGNRERWRNILTLDKDESVILWSWTQHGKYHDRYEAARRDPANAHLRFVQLRTPREIAAFLRGYTEGMATTVTDNQDLHRFEIRLDGELAGFIDYHQNGDVMVLVHTEVDERFRGHGLASELVRSALDDARARGFAVRPVCPLVRKYIQDHAEYQDLVLEADRAEFGL